MADTATPIIPPMDLQINLEDAPKEEKVYTQAAPLDIQPESSLDLSINLPEVSKNDDRLKTEDKKNNEAIIEKIETKVQTVETPTINPIMAEINNTIAVEKEAEPAKTIKEVNTFPEVTSIEKKENIVENIPESSSLKNDMKMINVIEGHTSAGGLAPEAILLPQAPKKEVPKTFDLDAMLGSPTPPTAKPVEITQPIIQAMPPAMPTPIPPPAFTIPTTTSQVPVQGISNVTMSHTQHTGVKALFFVVMFVALGFTTFFILKTMYPIEVWNLFNGGQVQMHASEITTGTDTLNNQILSGIDSSNTWTDAITGIDLTGTTIAPDLTSGIIDTGTGSHESAISTWDAIFGELNGLTTTPPATTETPAPTDISRLTDYISQGNDFLAQGKTIGNNTVIKYSLYITKKATTFLEKIANGEQINNLNWYFAQFDQYIAELTTLLGQTAPDLSASTISSANDTSGTTSDTGTTPAQ